MKKFVALLLVALTATTIVSAVITQKTAAASISNKTRAKYAQEQRNMFKKRLQSDQNRIALDRIHIALDKAQLAKDTQQLNADIRNSNADSAVIRKIGG